MTRSWTIFAMMLCGALAAGTRAVEAPAAEIADFFNCWRASGSVTRIERAEFRIESF